MSNFFQVTLKRKSERWSERERERERGEASMEGDKRGKSENIALKRSSKGFLFLFTVKKSPEKKLCLKC